MDSSQEPSHNETTVRAGPPKETFSLRSYQTEMVEASLKENIIVAMDTGSGKTHIALARTEAALATCDPNQLVWFLAPTKALCHQQYKIFCSHLPAFGVRFLTGDDNVDCWKDQSIWDDALRNIKIVISTHAVLRDALSHAFVKLCQLALLIFDEAHNCTRDHPANQIMQNFYLPLKRSNASTRVPRVLGLSASPVINAKSNGLAIIEKNLDSTTKTPRIHRSELIRFVHKPKLSIVTYEATNFQKVSNLHTSRRLDQIRNVLDIMQDPYIVQLIGQKNEGDHQATQRLEKVLMKRDTYCQTQIKSIATKAAEIYIELGVWASDWFLRQCTVKLQKLMDEADVLGTHLFAIEKQYLHTILKRALDESEPTSSPVQTKLCTPKVKVLIETLLAEFSPDFRGIIFAEQRVTVAVLSQLLSEHTQTKDIFRVGTFVGTSTHPKRKMNLADLAEPRQQQQLLGDFGIGDKNLVIATSVLEEGIDISSCHLVICFDPPANLKSFIQRRGRARKEKSKYIILMPSVGGIQANPYPWESLEDQMKDAYMNDFRQVKEAEERENTEEDSTLTFRIPSTGALLTLADASQHLHHFCAVLQSKSNIDMRPQFSFESDKNGLVKSHVMLPVSVNSSVRTASSSRSWITEKMATRDACFQAYIALHSAGLINDNLLPLTRHEDVPEFGIPDHRPSLVPVQPIWDSWTWVTHAQDGYPKEYHRNVICVSSADGELVRVVMLTPSSLPQISDLVLFWNETKQYTVTTKALKAALYNEEEVKLMKATTYHLLHSAFGSRMPKERDDFLTLFVPAEIEYSPISEELGRWLATSRGEDSCLHSWLPDQVQDQNVGLVQVRGDDRKFILRRILLGDDPTGTQLVVSRFPKRRDFLHPVNPQNQLKEAYHSELTLEAKDCVVHRLPASLSVFAVFVPSILYRVEIYLLAERLRTTILAPISVSPTQLSLVVQAITGSAAEDDQNYQRLEFLGDCILKFFTSVNLMASHLIWPEGYLTEAKGRTTSNGHLARATMKLGLERFIITKKFTGLKWVPRYAGDMLSNQRRGPEEKVLRSSKLIADIIESLIGMSYVIGGLPSALTCLQTLLPTEDWKPLADSQEELFKAVPEEPLPRYLDAVESLVDYSFTKKHLMLEALTHPSFIGPSSIASSSYQRLEFLGDAVLDYIIVDRLFTHTPELSHQTMHAIRTAMVNAAFLAFVSFENTVPEEHITINIDPITGERIPEKPVIVQKALWKFLRHSSPAIYGQQKTALERHNASRDDILSALKEDRKYPWHLLALTDAEKLFSDIVESMIGAVYVDSHGDIAACEGFVRKMGIMNCLERILRDEVDCLHPKERLGHLAVNDTVEYMRVRVEDKEKYFCQVKVGGREIGGVVGGMKRLNAETEAAWAAVNILEAELNTEMGDGVMLDEGEESEEYEIAMEKMEEE